MNSLYESLWKPQKDALISKIKPAVKAVTTPEEPHLRNSSNLDFVNSVAKKNISMTPL